MSTRGYKRIQCPFCGHDVTLSPCFYTYVGERRIDTYPVAMSYDFVRSCWHMGRGQANRIIFAEAADVRHVRDLVRIEIRDERAAADRQTRRRRLNLAKANPRRNPVPAYGRL